MPAYPSEKNTFLRSHEASGKLVVDFARNPKDFAVNKYAQVVPVKKVSGAYLKMTIEEAGRITDSNLNDRVWADGEAAPEGNDGTESFEWPTFYCVRRAFPVKLGNLTIDQADWDILAQHSRIKAAQAMTARTQLAITQAVATGNYDASHVLDVTAISGNTGRWDQSTTARTDIKRSITVACEKILDDTLAAINLDDLQLVINTKLAGDLAMSQEIVDYIKGSPDALAYTKGELKGENPNAFYGLPPVLYGVNLVVEKTRKVTSKKGATRAVSPVLPNATPFLAARPGSLEGVADAPSFSTLTIFAHEEMSAEVKNDPDNRRTIARIVENLVVTMTAPASGVMFQNATG